MFGNPKDRFSHDAAHISMTQISLDIHQTIYDQDHCFRLIGAKADLCFRWAYTPLKIWCIIIMCITHIVHMIRNRVIWIVE